MQYQAQEKVQIKIQQYKEYIHKIKQQKDFLHHQMGELSTKYEDIQALIKTLFDEKVKVHKQITQ